jgi:chemotaxis receptor (MCP) glutamine deamidase CheD/FixJ family two-component response regulator
MEPKKFFLLPAEMYFEEEPTEISTLLGSCVSVCLFNRKLLIGGMNHFMLDKAPPGQEPSTKFGDYATEALIQTMLSCDRNTANIEAAILGGGNVVGHLNIENGIGARNIAIARGILNKHNITIVDSRHTGGDYGRRLFFRTWNGELIVRRIEKSEETKITEAKKKELSHRKITVLVVDDSRTIRAIISDAISSDPDIEVVGQAEDPYEARELLLEYDPDVICLDIIMPRMDGITFLKKLFLYKPKPVIIISTVVQRDSKIRQQAESIGAVDVIDKAELEIYKNPEKVRSVLAAKIKLAAAVFVKKKTKEQLDNI